MDQLRPIFWGQGMFLQPQHFQQQDSYHEARLRGYLHWLYPFCWGVKSLVINEPALRNFMFEIELCELVTWDGTIVRFQGETLPSNARIVPRSFEPALDPGGRPLGVFLGLKRRQWEEDNVYVRREPGRNEAAGEKQRRYSLQELETPDLFAENGQNSSLQYLMHEVRLLFDQDTAVHSEDYELVKIAEVLRAAEAQGAVLSKRYIPPSLSVHTSPVLAGILKEIRDLLTAKGREFTEYKRQHRIQTMEMGARETAYLLIMQMLNRYIPLFHHHLEVQETHPSVLYALLRQLVGELSTFSETISVLGGPLPAYRHDQLWECFDAAIQVAKELLNELTKGPEYVVPLVFDGEYFAANLERRFFEGNNHYYLSIKVDIPPRDLERLLTETGKVCSREEMDPLRQRALPGLMARYLEKPPEELPRRAHSSYFELDHHGNLWKRIEQRQNIAVFCQLPPEQTEMQLMVIFES
ncbi:MAG TPA: type VI secretion system baseplate subunit TssK [Candidatus Tectomicrobia bacterium]